MEQQAGAAAADAAAENAPAQQAADAEGGDEEGDEEGDEGEDDARGTKRSREEEDDGEAANAPAAKEPRQPVKLGFREFASGKEAGDFFRNILSTLPTDVECNEVRSARFRMQLAALDLPWRGARQPCGQRLSCHGDALTHVCGMRLSSCSTSTGHCTTF